jgi:lipoate-protein ligase B
MNNAHEHVTHDKNHIIIGYGSHDEKIITLGRNNNKNIYNNIPQSRLFCVDRGGGPTAHEPGQVVLYPVIDLNNYGLCARDLIAIAESAMLSLCALCGVKAKRDPKNHGVFIDDKKVGFVGMRIKKYISYHGLALNILNDALIFKNFIPCNIKNLEVTSLCYHKTLNKSFDYYAHSICYEFVKALTDSIA